MRRCRFGAADKIESSVFLGRVVFLFASLGLLALLLATTWARVYTLGSEARDGCRAMRNDDSSARGPSFRNTGRSPSVSPASRNTKTSRAAGSTTGDEAVAAAACDPSCTPRGWRRRPPRSERQRPRRRGSVAMAPAPARAGARAGARGGARVQKRRRTVITYTAT